MITDVFLDQKRVNLRENTIKAASCDSFSDTSVGVRQWRGWRENWMEVLMVNTRAVSIGQWIHIEGITLCAGEMIDEDGGRASGMGVDKIGEVCDRAALWGRLQPPQ